MEPRSLTQLQPLLRSLAHSTTPRCLSKRATISSSPVSLPTTPRRHQSSTARTKRALKIAPHPSFLQPASAAGTHVVFNPPSSKPSVYHTPFKFLPPSDPRRRANLSQLLRAADSSPSSSSSAGLPPALPEPAKRYNVTREQVEEMRRLRAQDPARWSVLKLAERYECQPLFVMMCCRASAEHKDRERARLEAVKARWGPVRTKAREERKKRKVLLLKDDL